MNTVDTAFQISFLIRDGAVALETVDDLLSVRPTSSSEKQQNKRTDDNVQAILSLNFAKWQVSNVTTTSSSVCIVAM